MVTRRLLWAAVMFALAACGDDAPLGADAGDGSLIDALPADTSTASLTVQRANPLPGDRVTSSPAGIDCPGRCVATYLLGTEVTLTVTTDPQSIFLGYFRSGCGNPCRVTLTGDTLLTATFARPQP